MIVGYESDTVAQLKAARDVAWATLQPAFDHAIALALEAEHQSERASNEVQAGIAPTYPPLVMMLAEAAPSIS